VRKHPTVRCAAIAFFVFTFLSPLACIADQRDLTAQELKAMLDSNQKVFLINPLSDIEFNEGHIPGSVNIPLHTIMRSDKLPESRDAIIVTYCLSPQ
jgi:rhodanese-related sulfurtransferase